MDDGIASTQRGGDGPLPEGLMEEWEWFLSQEHQPEDVFDNGMLFPLQRKREWREMMRLAALIGPQTVMEIGADKGGGLWTWCRCLPTIKHIIGCEIRGTPYAFEFKNKFASIDFFWMPQSSYAPESVCEVDRWLKSSSVQLSKAKIDVLFLDGDKSWFHRDYDLYRPLLSDKAMVFFHDITDPAPGSSFEVCCQQAYAENPGCWATTIIDNSESFEALEREPKTAHDHWLRHWKGQSCGVGVIRPKGGPLR